MYKSFFGLKKNPFNVNPDPAYLYLTRQMRQALDELTYGIESRKGLMLLTGDAGTGKTTLINHLLLWLGHQRARTAFIFNSHLNSDQLFDFILSDFEIRVTPQTTANPLLAFNEWLLARYRSHDLVVLIVDEAQGLPVHVLEEIRLLSNMETPNEKLLQIVLAGQPELETKLKRPDLRQLHQRISLRCRTAPLTLQETHGYIEDRLHTAGLKRDTIFLPEAVEAIHNFSRGVPRVINLLCENALIHAYVEQESAVPSGIIDEAARELQFDEFRPVAPRVRMITQAADAPDLHSILAKIKAEADDGQVWAETQKAIPYLVSAQKTAFHNEVEVVDSAENKVDSRAVSKSLPAAVNLRPHAYAETRVQYWRLKRSRFAEFFQTNLAGARALFETFNLRSVLEPARPSLKGLGLGNKFSGFASRVRSTAEPRLLALSEAIGPEFKARASTFKNSIGAGAEFVRHWWEQNFSEEMYGKSFVATAAASTILYLIARRMNPAQGWHHPGLLVVAFAGFLLCALSLAMGVTVLVRARQKVRQDSSELLTSAVRWLRAPISPMQMRELGSIGGKVQSQRRA